MEHKLDSPSKSEDSTQLPVQLTQQRSVSKHESDSKNDIGPQVIKIQPQIMKIRQILYQIHILLA